MARQYFRKKNAGELGPLVDWIEMDGKEFYRFVRSREGQGRYFIDFDDYVIEATRDQYEDWRREKEHSDYLRKQEDGLILLSLYSDAINGYGDGEDVIMDDRVNVEETAIQMVQSKALYSALRHLDTPSYQLIYDLYLKDRRWTERALAKHLGVSQNAINKQKKKILRKLKILVVKAEKKFPIESEDRKMGGHSIAPRKLNIRPSEYLPDGAL